MNTKTKKLTTTAMLCALAYAAVTIGRIPIVMFLKYDPKDIIIVLGGLIYGPSNALIISIIVSFIEMLTISETGILGCIMNIISSCSFACPVALIYRKKKSMSGVIMGLLIGCITMTAVMILWNYLITPFYMGYPREAVAKLLIPIFLPFNMLKGTLNTVFTCLLYKAFNVYFKKTGLLDDTTKLKPYVNIGTIALTLLIIITCILVILVMKGMI